MPLHSTSTTTSKSGNTHFMYYALLLVGAIGGMMMFSSVQRVNQLPGSKLALSGKTETMMAHLQESAEDHVDHMLGSIHSIASRQAVLRQQFDQQHHHQEQQKHQELHRQAQQQQQVLDSPSGARAAAAHSRARQHVPSRPIAHQQPPPKAASATQGAAAAHQQAPPVVKGPGPQQQQRQQHHQHDTVRVPKGPSTANCDAASAELLSMGESGGFFCDSDESWLVRKEIARLQQPHQQRTSPFGMNALYQENWEPNFSCEYERRLGQPGDGGKWVCDPHKLQQQSDCLVYSFGSNNAFDFEEAIHKSIGAHCEIHTFDHTIGQNPTRRPKYVNFHPWGIGTAKSGVLRSLDQIAKDLNHLGRRIHIFKIDVEGAEFRALPQLLSAGIFDKLGIQQVLIEVHRDSPKTVHTLMEAFHRAGYAIFHKEANIQFPMSPADVCVEFAFVKLGKAFFSPGIRVAKPRAAPAKCTGAPGSLAAMKESSGFFCDDDEAWKVKREIARLQQPHQKRTSPRGMRALYQENWEPNFSCGYERRLGQPGDGGKWVCDPHKLQQQSDCLVYSFGSNNAFDFEEAIHKSIGAHCEIHTFDHTIGQNPSRRPKYVNFHPWGIGTAKIGVLRSLDQIAKDLNHLGRKIHIFKIDVEGAEFSTLPQLLNDGVFDKLGIQQVLIEVHRSAPATVHALMEAFHRAGYVIFHKEPNIQFPMSNADVCVEFAFIKLGWSPRMLV